MSSKNYRWLGASDPVHFDYVGGGTINMKGTSVLAFQRLWNRNNPNDRIAEDGQYGPTTENRLSRSPVGGFATGPTCQAMMSAPSDEPLPEGVGEVDLVPDATESGTADDEKTTASAPLPNDESAPSSPAPGAQGCSSSGGYSSSFGFVGLAGLAIAAGAIARRRR